MSLTRGPFTAATIEALNAAEKLPRVAKAEYELRFLKAPAVYFAALWLHSGNDDILIPMVDPPGRLEKEPRLFGKRRSSKALREIADQNKRFHDNFKEPGPSRAGKEK